VYHQAHRRLIDAHPERARRDYDIDTIAKKIVERHCARGLAEPRVVRRRAVSCL
jgi:hypothetical protein